MSMSDFKTEFDMTDKTNALLEKYKSIEEANLFNKKSNKNDPFYGKDMNISLNLNDSQLKLPIEIINSLNESIAKSTSNTVSVFFSSFLKAYYKFKF